MLSFAASFSTATALCAEPAFAGGTSAVCAVAADTDTDAGAGVQHPTYWPCDLLNAFVLKMAAHGCCVNMSMMLGHRAYALEQLALARSVHDGDLHQLATPLLAYFSAPADGEPGRASGHVSTQTLFRP